MLKATWKFSCLAYAALLLLMGLNGCSQQPASTAANALKLPPAKPHRVDFVNLTARTAAVDAAPAVSSEEFLAKVQALQQMDATPSRIQRLAQRFPDAALEALRNTSPAEASHPARIATAIAYDRAFVAYGAGWTVSLAQAVAHPGEYEACHQSRLQALQLIEMGRPQRVAITAPSSGDSIAPFMRAESLRVQGIAALLRDQPADAQRLWRSAIELAAADRGVCSELHLLMATSLSHQGLTAGANAEWSLAANVAAGICDPGLWQRLLEAKNESADWSPAVAAAVESRGGLATTMASGESKATATAHVESCIWRQIGEWRLSRGELPGALLAFKQAESLSNAPREKADSRIAQARALIAMNQTGAAVSILTSLVADRDPLVSHRAMAVLGNARIALDDIPGALSLLTRAVADDDAFPTSLRAPARADLGLVCLMSSHEQEGLNWLHRAQADFEHDRNNADLVQCLRNEANYLDKSGRVNEAIAINDRASRLSALP